MCSLVAFNLGIQCYDFSTTANSVFSTLHIMYGIPQSLDFSILENIIEVVGGEIKYKLCTLHHIMNCSIKTGVTDIVLSKQETNEEQWNPWSSKTTIRL